MAAPEDRRYSNTHEWHMLEDSLVVLGISQFAVDELTDITYLEVTRQSGPIKAGEVFGEIESVKATSELYSGIDGEIIEVNQRAIENPALINEDPYGQGWIVKINPTDSAQLENLMAASEYEALHIGS